ncbi:MAG: hypothetical protein ABL890_02570 [Candidatus Peribacteraceae bacterium]
MHVRASHIRGMHVVDDSTQFLVGLIDHPLIQPDTGTIIGFFVLSVQGMGDSILFLSTLDIVQWGTVVHIRSEDVLAPPHELVRLEESLHERRTILSQPIRVRPGGVTLGRCVDVQFDTATYFIEWLFPRRWYLMRDPIPVTEIIEVTKNAIWVKPPLRVLPEKKTEKTMERPILPATDSAVATMQRDPPSHTS